MIHLDSGKTQNTKVVGLFNRFPKNLRSPHSEIGRESYGQNTEGHFPSQIRIPGSGQTGLVRVCIYINMCFHEN